jgi:hypothetical protein
LENQIEQQAMIYFVEEVFQIDINYTVISCVDILPRFSNCPSGIFVGTLSGCRTGCPD